jgi:hypothetical protein
VPLGMSHWTVMLPTGFPTIGRIALLARVWPPLKLMVEACGEGVPVENILRSPLPLAPTTVTFAETATAPAGMPHWPSMRKLRWAPPPFAASLTSDQERYAMPIANKSE